MKLTPKNIKAIEDLLTRREGGARLVDLCPFEKQAISSRIATMGTFFRVLKGIGIVVDRAVLAERAFVSRSEMNEFREWQKERTALTKLFAKAE